MTAAIRLGRVTLSRDVLEGRFGAAVDRFVRSRAGEYFYAQINVPDDGDVLVGAAAILRRFGPALLSLAADGVIGTPTLDLAFGFSPSLATHSAVVPHHIAKIAGAFGIDLEISTYPTVE